MKLGSNRDVRRGGEHGAETVGGRHSRNLTLTAPAMQRWWGSLARCFGCEIDRRCQGHGAIENVSWDPMLHETPSYMAWSHSEKPILSDV